MKELKENYKKYRWFFTSSGKLVIGGKNAEQNEEIMQKILSSEYNVFVMHTSEPGSPFSVILCQASKVTFSDKNEVAVFTASFSRGWREGKKRSYVNIFLSSQVYKNKKMKLGTFGVKGKIENIQVPLELALIRQKSVLRAIPLISIKDKKRIICLIVPGAKDKGEFVISALATFKKRFSKEELLSSLPSGGIKIKDE